MLEKKGVVISVTDVKETVKKGTKEPVGFTQDVVIYQPEVSDGDKIFQYEQYWPFRIFSKEKFDKKFIPAQAVIDKDIVRVQYHDRGNKFEGDKGVQYFVNYHLTRWEKVETK